MGIADRDYHRKSPAGGGFSLGLTPVVRWLLIANVAVYFVDMFTGHPLMRFGTFSIPSAIHQLHVWEFVTFQFLHGSLGHLLFNALGLYFFGPWMERWWGCRKFVVFYLLCGVAGAVLFTLLYLSGVFPHFGQTGLIGASAGIYGIFIGVAVISPGMRVTLLFPPVELSMRQLAIALLAISAGAILLGIGGNEGGEAGHLGGAVLGYLLVRRPSWLGGGAGRSEASTAGRAFVSKLRPRTRITPGEDSAVDLILDKISSEGFQSLTDAEREILRKASEDNQQGS